MRHVHKPASGIALLEVLISLVIITLGLLGLAAMQITTLQGNMKTRQYEAASYGLNQLMERLSSNTAGVANGYYNFNNLAASARNNKPDDSCDESDISDGCKAKRELSVWLESLKVVLPSPRIKISTNTSVASGAQVTAQIVWNAALKTNSDSQNYASVCDKNNVDSYQCNQLTVWLPK